MSSWYIEFISCPLCGKEATCEITGTAGDHVPAEIEYWCKEHGMVGFWAYGFWQPEYPFNGDSL